MLTLCEIPIVDMDYSVLEYIQLITLAKSCGFRDLPFSVDLEVLSYPVFMPKPSTHRMQDPGSIVPHIRPKVHTDNQMLEYRV
jgi:hypothetical protein